LISRLCRDVRRGTLARMVKPIRPGEVASAASRAIPDEVFQAFNDLIAENWVHGRDRAIVKQKDVLARVTARLDVTADEVLAKHWFDVEPSYRAAGWTVTYDKSGWDESYEPYFEFRRKK